MTLAVRAWVVALTLATAQAAAGAGEIAPGAYCPLPEADEARQCLEPARARYGEFFQALEGPELTDAGLSRVEAELAAGSGSQNPYLALSTLSYGYYRLSQRVAADPQASPEMLARLERWNGLLARAYEASPADAAFRQAVREAAVDIQQRAPAVRLPCADARGEPAECDSSEAVIRGIDAADGRVGLRGALERLIERMRGGDS